MFKRNFLAIAICYILVVTSFPIISFAEDKGNIDSKVTAADARMVLQSILGIKPLTDEQTEKWDVYKDGVINGIDARQILRVASNLDELDDADMHGVFESSKSNVKPIFELKGHAKFGGIYELSIVLKDTEDLAGADLILDYNPAILQFNSLESDKLSGITSECNKLSDGKIAISFFTLSDKKLYDGIAVLTLNFKTLKEEAPGFKLSFNTVYDFEIKNCFSNVKVEQTCELPLLDKPHLTVNIIVNVNIFIDSENKMINKVAANLNPAAFLAQFVDADFVLSDNEGNPLNVDALVGTGTKVTLEEGVVYTVVVSGDVDGDGNIAASDARSALRASAGLEKLDGAFFSAANVSEESEISAQSARQILRVSAGLDSFK